MYSLVVLVKRRVSFHVVTVTANAQNAADNLSLLNYATALLAVFMYVDALLIPFTDIKLL